MVVAAGREYRVFINGELVEPADGEDSSTTQSSMV